MNSTISKRSAARPGSQIALAIALLCGTALTAGALESPAAAQKKKKNKETAKDYSKGFIEAYTIANDLMNEEPANVAAAAAAVPNIEAVVSTQDDRMAAGQFMVNVGQASSNDPLTLRGLEMMLASGKIPADKTATYLVNAGDFARRAGDLETARKHFMAAHAAGHVKDDLPPIIAATYFDENRNQEGIAYLRGLVDAQIAAGQTPNPMWIDVAFSSAYNNDMTSDAINLSAMAVNYHPNEKNWRNAIAIQRNLVEMSDDMLLDIMRLSDRTDTLQDGRDYADYIEAADPRRLPGEAKLVLDEAIAKGALETSDPFVKDARETVTTRIAADKTELPALERDASASGAKLATVMAAGDVLLSYGEPAKAETFYTSALTKPGVATDRVLTRLGIAQADQGKFAEASSTFAKISGQRSALAALWKAYADTQATSPTTAAM